MTFTLGATWPDQPKVADRSRAVATKQQKAAARKNVKKAAGAAKRKKTIAKLPKKTRTALAKQGAKVAKQKHRGRRGAA